MIARYRIVPERSRFLAEARSSLHPIHVDTSGFEGTIDVEIANGRVDLSIAPQAHVEIATERFKTGNLLYDRELERRLEVQRYRRVRADVRRVTAIDDTNRLRVRGEVHFHGATKNVEGEVTVRVVDDRTIEIDGERQFDMRDFGLEPPRILMLRVYPEVRVRAHIVAERES
jgi:polyisoprenoid-binding protein YceI